MKEFNDLRDIREPTENNLLIVDSFNLAFRYKHKHITEFREDYIKTIISLSKSYDCKDIIILGDKGSIYRDKIFPNYKSDRRKRIQNQTPEEKQEFELFFAEYKATMNSLTNYTVFWFDGIEADDIAAYLVKKYKNRYNNIWLISSDKDWNLLLDNNVHRFSYVTRKETTIDSIIDETGFTVEDYLTFKILTGDSSDSIPGVPGIGLVRSKSLISKYESIFDLYAELPLPGKYVYITALNNFKDQLLINHNLIDLLTFCEEIIGEENCNIIDQKMEEINVR